MKMYATGSSETLVTIYQINRRHNSKVYIRNVYCSEKLRPKYLQHSFNDCSKDCEKILGFSLFVEAVLKGKSAVAA
jgi:hypothetical protein